MRFCTLLGASLLAGVAALPAPHTAVAAARAAAAQVADETTTDNADPAYRRLLDAESRGLTQALQAGTDKLSQPAIDKARQPAGLADTAWLAAGGYDFATADNQAADVKVLAPFTTLPRAVLERNDAAAAQINHEAPPGQKQHALYDADGLAFLFFPAEALGPKLGAAFLRAYEAGEIRKAAALIKATEVSTATAKAYYNYPRPFLIDGNTIELVRDAYVAGDGVPYRATGGAYPSGHANAGYTDGLLLAAMLPERYLPLLARAAGYGYSRVVLGVHYPLDVIGSRMIAERNVAHDLGDPHYRALFAEARDELRAALEKECGESLAACARPGSAAEDPWAAADEREFHRFTMTYDLPRVGRGDVPTEVPAGAEMLLESLRPDLSAAERRDLLARTALPSGYALDSQDPDAGFWQRLDLYEAALAASRR